MTIPLLFCTHTWYLSVNIQCSEVWRLKMECVTVGSLIYFDITTSVPVKGIFTSNDLGKLKLVFEALL